MPSASRQFSTSSTHSNPAIPRVNSSSPLDLNRFTQPQVVTRSMGFGSAVSFERTYANPSDSDLIIVTVKLRDEFRANSVDGSEDLPCRPAPRSFLTRLHTRLSSSSRDTHDRYKALKMPRGDYKRYFVRDAQGNFAGTEPERSWSLDQLLQEYGEYQELPLGSMIC